MKRTIFLIIAIMLFPSKSEAISRLEINFVSGHIGYPLHHGITVFLGMRIFPIPGNSVFSRMGLDYNMFRGENFTYGSNGTEYESAIFMPFQFLILLYPSNITAVGSKNPIYTYLYFGGEAMAIAHKKIEQVHTWGGRNARFWNGGVGVSFRGIIDINVGYTRINIDDQLGVDSHGNFIEYIPKIESNRIDATIKLNLGSAIIDWIKSGLPD